MKELPRSMAARSREVKAASRCGGGGVYKWLHFHGRGLTVFGMLKERVTKTEGESCEVGTDQVWILSREPEGDRSGEAIHSHSNREGLE